MKRARIQNWWMCLWFTLVSACGVPMSALSYDVETHRLLGEKAAEVSSLESVLKAQLEFHEGLQTKLLGSTVQEWIGKGAKFEDEPFPRVLNHFHNPLEIWERAGLRLLGAQVGQSSIRWGQNASQSPGGTFSWLDARRFYYQALTSPTKAEREQTFTQTFRALGQVMHLVQDAAVPAHVRNDPHLVREGFEAWVSRRENQSVVQGLLASPYVRPDSALYTLGVPIPDPIATVPIARLWDSDQYNDGNPDITTLSQTIGLAEYTNANFFSDDTVFNKFPFPASTSVELGPPEPEPKTGELRRYFKKVRHGELINHLAVPSALYEFLPEALKDQKKGLDDNVFRDYAAKLLPRAVGYSAALLDYFFRGGLFTFGDTGTLAFANYSREPMEGSFTLYYDDAEEKRNPVSGASWTLPLGVGNFVGNFSFSGPVDPAPLEPDSYILVFQGTFGGEAKAVVGKRVIIPSVITVRLLTRTRGNPLGGYKVEAVENGSGKVLSWNRTDRNGKASIQWKAGKTLIRIQGSLTREQTIYWAGEKNFSSTSEGARIVTYSEIDSKGELIITFPVVKSQSIVAVEPCTGLLMKEIPCDAGNVDCLADDPSWKLPLFANYWPTWPGVAGSLLSSSGVRTGEAISMLGGVGSAVFIRDDIGEQTVIIDAYKWTGKRIIPDALHAEDLNRIGVSIGRLVVSYWSEYTRYFENEDGEMIGSPICRNTYNETVSLPVWLADVD